MIGAYLEPASTELFFRAPASELADQIIDLERVWGWRGRIADDLAGLGDASRISRLEAELVDHFRRGSHPSTRALAALAQWAGAHPLEMTVQRLADAAGLSTRHLNRVFRQAIGVSPKRYCRLARFHAGLAYTTGGEDNHWANVAIRLGYADQSHMIAEFREFSSLTPECSRPGRGFTRSFSTPERHT